MSCGTVPEALLRLTSTDFFSPHTSGFILSWRKSTWFGCLFFKNPYWQDLCSLPYLRCFSLAPVLFWDFSLGWVVHISQILISSLTLISEDKNFGLHFPAFLNHTFPLSFLIGQATKCSKYSLVCFLRMSFTGTVIWKCRIWLNAHLPHPCFRLPFPSVLWLIAWKLFSF